MKKLISLTLVVVMVLGCISLVACNGGGEDGATTATTTPPANGGTTPAEGENGVTTTPPEEEPPPTPPEPGEWTITRWTGPTEFRVLTFTVSPFILITGYSYQYPGFWSGNLYTDHGSCRTAGPEYGEAIIDNQFTDELRIPRGEGLYWDLVFQGEFDETGTHASGTWEASLEGSPYAEGTWEASAP
ncbi:MAG TPA: hypothetical protein G4N91_01405 [Dehalococcoidia bacterium]|nr:hypothetical protein [Dehalococcoidia bacterium]